MIFRDICICCCALYYYYYACSNPVWVLLFQLPRMGVRFEYIYRFAATHEFFRKRATVSSINKFIAAFVIKYFEQYTTLYGCDYCCYNGSCLRWQFVYDFDRRRTFHLFADVIPIFCLFSSSNQWLLSAWPIWNHIALCQHPHTHTSISFVLIRWNPLMQQKFHWMPAHITHHLCHRHPFSIRVPDVKLTPAEWK